MKETKRKKYIYINGIQTKYIVTDMGTVYSTDYMHTGKVKKLKYNTDKNGYKIATIYLDGKRYDKKVHRLVAEAFIKNPFNKPEVNHKDGDKSNNKKSNLEWSTTKENLHHAFATGLNTQPWNQYGEKNPSAVHTEKTIKKVCRALQSNKYSKKEISKKYGVSIDTIEQILYGNQWTTISRDYDLSKFDRNKSGKKFITNDQAIEICILLEEGGLTLSEISKKVGVSYKSVFRIYSRESKRGISKHYDFSKTPVRKDLFGRK